MFWRARNYDRGLINIYFLEDLLWLSWWRAGEVIYLPRKCAERSVVKPDKTVNLKVHCGITNVIIMACAEQPSVFLESSLDDSCGPCFHSSCPGWVMVCWPEPGICTAPPVCGNLVLHTNSICCYLKVSNLCSQRTKIQLQALLSGVEGTLLILLLVHLGSLLRSAQEFRAQLSPVASLLNIKHWLGAVSCLPYNFQPLTLFYDALRRLLRK